MGKALRKESFHDELLSRSEANHADCGHVEMEQ
jgi:hypothetical protein